nr:transcriptional regulatory protein AlgP-like [Aegilops tauschii subsp. strangulata]
MAAGPVFRVRVTRERTTGVDFWLLARACDRVDTRVAGTPELATKQTLTLRQPGHEASPAVSPRHREAWPVATPARPGSEARKVPAFALQQARRRRRRPCPSRSPASPHRKPPSGSTTTTRTAGHLHQVTGPPSAEPHHRRAHPRRRGNQRSRPAARSRTPAAAHAARRPRRLPGGSGHRGETRPTTQPAKQRHAPRARTASAHGGGARVAPSHGEEEEGDTPPAPAPVGLCPAAPPGGGEGGGRRRGADGGGIWASAPAASRVGRGGKGFSYRSISSALLHH